MIMLSFITYNIIITFIIIFINFIMYYGPAKINKYITKKGDIFGNKDLSKICMVSTQVLKLISGCKQNIYNAYNTLIYSFL